MIRAVLHVEGVVASHGDEPSTAYQIAVQAGQLVFIATSTNNC